MTDDRGPQTGRSSVCRCAIAKGSAPYNWVNQIVHTDAKVS